MAKETVKENMSGLMAINMKETGLIIWLMDMENILGVMEEYTRANGLTIMPMEKEYSTGKMVDIMRVFLINFRWV